MSEKRKNSILWRNTEKNWGLVNILIHWVTVLAVIFLFSLGLWMEELDYYHPWYHPAPYIHKSIGILLFLLISFRVVWRITNKTPRPLASHNNVERLIAPIVHKLLYILLFATMISGYLIATAYGKGVEVFGWFEFPALIQNFKYQKDFVGIAHFYLPITLVVLMVLHALAALKHHFIDKDVTLKRMLKYK